MTSKEIVMRIGVDMGGTKIEAAVVSEAGNILKRARVPTEANKGKEVVLANILSAVKQLDQKRISSIGLSMTGVINTEGIMIYSPNITCLEGVNVAEYIRHKTKKKVSQENDANCFAIAETKFGAAKGSKNVVGLIIGTGVGSGIIINGELYKGKTNGGGELGHMIIGKGKEFEDFCSGPAIRKRYLAAGGKIDYKYFNELMDSKEAVAVKITKETFKYLGIGFANIINILDPEVIVVGGGLSNIPFYNQIKDSAKKYAIPSLFKDVKIVKNKLGDSAGVIGAAFL